MRALHTHTHTHKHVCVCVFVRLAFTAICYSPSMSCDYRSQASWHCISPCRGHRRVALQWFSYYYIIAGLSDNLLKLVIAHVPSSLQLTHTHGKRERTHTLHARKHAHTHRMHTHTHAQTHTWVLLHTFQDKGSAGHRIHTHRTHIHTRTHTRASWKTTPRSIPHPTMSSDIDIPPPPFRLY